VTQMSSVARVCQIQLGFLVCFVSAESYGLAAEAYGDALEGCKKTAKKVEEKFVSKMQDANVRRRIILVYTVSHKKRDTCIFVTDNSGEY